MQGSRTAGQEWRANWTLVLASSIGFSFFSVMLGTVGLFMEPLQQEFGWNRTLVSSGTSIAVIATAILGPLFGAMVDRFGTRRLTLPGVVLTTLSIASFSLLDGSAALWFGLWAAFGIVSVSIKSTAWTAAVVGVFDKSRGLALAVTLGGTALSQTIVPPLGNYLIEEFGWRAAYVWLGLGWGGITLLLCVLFFYDVNDERRRAGRAAKAAGRPQDASVLPGLTMPQALRDSALWRVAISNFIVMLLTMGLAVHLFPILTDAGVDRADAAWLVALGGIAGIVGKLVTGVLVDRYKPNWVGAFTLGVAAVVFLFLMNGVRSPTLIVIAMIINGYTAGTKTQITAFLTAGYSGMKNFGTIYGFMSALMALASGMGPLLAGRVYDATGGYGPFMLAGVIGCTLGGLLIATLPAYPKFDPELDEVLADPGARAAPIAPGADR
jgi:predicted MFS family arabinose efflux permease